MSYAGLRPDKYGRVGSILANLGKVVHATPAIESILPLSGVASRAQRLPHGPCIGTAPPWGETIPEAPQAGLICSPLSARISPYMLLRALPQMFKHSEVSSTEALLALAQHPTPLNNPNYDFGRAEARKRTLRSCLGSFNESVFVVVQGPRACSTHQSAVAIVRLAVCAFSRRKQATQARARKPLTFSSFQRQGRECLRFRPISPLEPNEAGKSRIEAVFSSPIHIRNHSEPSESPEKSSTLSPNIP